MNSLLPVLKFFQLAANAIFMALCGSMLSSNEFSILVVVIFSVSAYSLVENVIFYSNRHAVNFSIGKFPLLLAFVYAAYLLNQPLQYTPVIIFSIIAYVVARYCTTLYEHTKEKCGWGIEVSILRLHASIIHLTIAITLLWFGILSVLLAYFVGAIFSLIYINARLNTFENKQNAEEEKAKKSDVFGFKVLFSSLSGYVLNYYFLLLVKINDTVGFNQTSVAVSLYSSVLAILLSEAFARRANRSQELVFFDRASTFSCVVIVFFSIALLAIHYGAPHYFSEFDFVMTLHEKLPGNYIVAMSCLIFILQFICASLAIKVRSHHVEPVFFANVFIFILALVVWCVDLAINVNAYLFVQLFINIVILLEVSLWCVRLRKEARNA